MEIKATTNLKKIAKLRKRIWCIQGSQASAKTYSILIIIINHCLNKQGKEVYIVSEELSKMKITVIKDFKNILRAFGVWDFANYNQSENIYTFKTGSTIKFLGLDKIDIGKGLRSDIVFINEANKIKFEAYRELTSRSKKIILDYNPNGTFWAHNEVITRDDCDFLKLTFEGNECISDEEKGEILRYKEKAYNTDGTVKSEYWKNIWQVYGLGEVGSVTGRIYNWTKISDNDFDKINSEEYYYADFGLVDPFAVGCVKYYDGNIYIKEINYKSENQIRQSLTTTELIQINAKEDDGLVSWLFNKWNIPKNKVIICDSNRPSKILTLRRAGWEMAVAIGAKSKLLDRIGMLQNLNIYFTESSTNIDFEQQNYRYAVDKFNNQLEMPVDDYCHHIDGLSYVITYLFNNGVIKNI
jgi:phage terminase large subunit